MLWIEVRLDADTLQMENYRIQGLMSNKKKTLYTDRTEQQLNSKGVFGLVCVKWV